MHANVMPFYTPLTPVRGQKVKAFFFSEEGYGAHHIMQLNVRHYAHPWPVGLGKKVRH